MVWWIMCWLVDFCLKKLMSSSKLKFRYILVQCVFSVEKTFSWIFWPISRIVKYVCFVTISDLAQHRIVDLRFPICSETFLRNDTRDGRHTSGKQQVTCSTSILRLPLLANKVSNSIQPVQYFASHISWLRHTTAFFLIGRRAPRL